MSIIDIILLICLIPALFSGLRKGFISQLISVISIIAGVWLSFEFATIAGEWLGQYIEASEGVLRIAAFALIMVAIFLLLGLIGKILEKIINLVMLGWLNRLLGVIVALMKSALIIGLLIIVFNSINTSFDLVDEEVLAESILYTPFKDLAYAVFPYIKELITSIQ